jgi:hypothetical protein
VKEKKLSILRASNDGLTSPDAKRAFASDAKRKALSVFA